MDKTINITTNIRYIFEYGLVLIVIFILENLSAIFPEIGSHNAIPKLLVTNIPPIASGELSVASPASMNNAITVNQSPIYEIISATNSLRKGLLPLKSWKYPTSDTA